LEGKIDEEKKRKRARKEDGDLREKQEKGALGWVAQ